MRHTWLGCIQKFLKHSCSILQVYLAVSLVALLIFFFGYRNSLLKLASCYIVEVTNATYQSLVSLTSFKALKQAEGNAEVYVEAEYFILAYMCDFSIRKLEKKNRISCTKWQLA